MLKSKRKPEAARRAHWVQVRVTRSQHLAIQTKANAAGMTVSDWLRKLAEKYDG